jgi:hypothetical protein
MRGWVRPGLLVVASVCFVAVLSYRMSVDRQGPREVRRDEVGVTGSPWFVREVVEEDGRLAEWRTRVTFWSWSVPVLAVGLLCLGLRDALRPEKRHAVATEAGVGP